MKYFTPDLCEKLNSEDDAVVSEAVERWDAAVAAYDRRLKAIAHKLPTDLRRFVRGVYLHDAEVMPFSRGAGSVFPANGAKSTSANPMRGNRALCLHRNGRIILLVYGGVEETRGVRKSTKASKRNTQTILWLYDEVDLADADVFSHEILFSNGETTHLVFRDFTFREFDANRILMDAPRRSVRAGKCV